MFRHQFCLHRCINSKDIGVDFFFENLSGGHFEKTIKIHISYHDCLGLSSVVSGAKWTTKMLQSVCLQFCPGRSVNWLDYYTFRSLYCIYQLLQKTFYRNDHTITEFGIIDNKNSSTAYVILYELIDTWFLDSNRRVRVWLLPWRWHILSIPLTTGRGKGVEICGLDDMFPPDDLCSRPEALCYIYIYIYMHFLYEFCYRTNIYIQQECHSVLVKLHPITFYKTVFLGSAQFLGWMPLFVFFGLPILSNSLMIIV